MDLASLNEWKQHQLYCSEVHRQVPFESKGMDEPTPTIEVNMTGHTENIFLLACEDLMSASELVHSSVVLIGDHAVSILGDY